MNKSPLRYPGGKTKACVVLDKIFSENFNVSDFKKVRSPFFGGGSFEFFLQNKYGYRISANDKFTPLSTFWKTCKNDKDTLCDSLQKVVGKITKEKFTEYRKNIITTNDSVMYFVINRCSFSGATLSGGFSEESSRKRFTQSSIDRIRNLDLSRFKIYNLDFKEYINRNENSVSNFLFLDPPYYLLSGSKLYGNNGDMHETFDHERLFQCVSKRKKWMMTYNNCEYIKNLYKDFKIIETNWSYGMNKSKKSSEIVIVCK